MNDQISDEKLAERMIAGSSSWQKDTDLTVE